MASSDRLTLGQRDVLLTVRTQLRDELAGVFGPETIERFLTDSLDKLLPPAPQHHLRPRCSPNGSPVNASAPAPRSKDCST